MKRHLHSRIAALILTFALLLGVMPVSALAFGSESVEVLKSDVYVSSLCETDDAIYYIEKTAAKKHILYTLKGGQSEPESLSFSSSASTTFSEMYAVSSTQFLMNSTGDGKVYYLDLKAETPSAILQKTGTGSGTAYTYAAQAKDGNWYANYKTQMYRFDPETASWTAVGAPNTDLSNFGYKVWLGDTLYSVKAAKSYVYAWDQSKNISATTKFIKTETDEPINRLQRIYRASDNTLFLLAGLNTTDSNLSNAVLLYTPQGTVEDLGYQRHMKTIADFSDTIDATIRIDNLLPAGDGKCYILAIKTSGETSSIAIYYFDGTQTTEVTYDQTALSGETINSYGALPALLSTDGKLYVSCAYTISNGFLMRCTLQNEEQETALPTVTDISAGAPENGTETTVTASLRNDTGEAISELPLCLKIDGSTVEEEQKLTLAAGAETTVLFSWTPAVGGSSALELWSGSTLLASKAVTVEEAAIYDVAVSDIKGTDLYPGRTCIISAALENKGNRTGEVIVTFYQGDTQFFQKTVSSPAPGESVRVGEYCVIPNDSSFRVEAAFTEYEDNNPEDNNTSAKLPVGKGMDGQWVAMSGVNGTFLYDMDGVEGGPIFASYYDNGNYGMLEYAGNGIWKNANAPAAKYYSIFMDSADSGWALVDNGSGVAMYQYDGDAWVQVSECGMTMNSSYSPGRRGACKIGDEIYCLTNQDGTLLVYHVSDNSWSTLTCKQAGNSSYALWASQEGKLYLSSDDIYIYNGTDWTNMSFGSAYYIVGESDNDFYALKGQVLYHYDGTNWTNCGMPALKSSNKIAYCDGAVYVNDPVGKGFFKYDGAEIVYLPCPGDASNNFFTPLPDMLVLNNSGTFYYTGSALEDLNGLEPAEAERTVWISVNGTDFQLPLTKVTVTVPYDVATAIDSKDFTGVTEETSVNVTHALVKALHEQYGVDISDKVEGLEITYQWGAYIRMINGNTASGMSGWMYWVNGWIPNVGASGYDLWQGDQIVWFWGSASSITTTSYSAVQADKSYVEPGDSVRFRTYDIKPSGSTQAAATYQVVPAEKTLYVNGSGQAYRTNANENYSIDIRFSEGGIYQVSNAFGEVELVTKTRADGSKYVTAQATSTDGIIGSIVPVEVTVLTGTKAEESVILTDLDNTAVASGQIAFLASTTDDSKLVVKVNGKEQYNPVSKNRYVVNLLDGENVIELFAGDPNGVYSLERFTVTASGTTTGSMTVTTTAKTETVSKSEYSFAVEGQNYDGGAITITVKVNDVEIQPEGKTYTATLNEGTNIIVISAESSTQWRDMRYVVTYDPSVGDAGTLRERVETALQQTNSYVGALTSLNEWNTFALDIQDGLSSGRLNDLLQMVVTSADAKAGTDQEVVTDYAKWTLALRAAGGNPLAAVYGSSQYDLLDKIYNFPSDLYAQGINAPAWALLALDSGEYEVPEDAKYSREDLLDYLLKAQEEDGGWKLSASYSSADVDITAMVLQALAPYQSCSDVQTAIDKAVNWLASQQNVKGQYESMGSFSSESIAQVIIALCANGIDPVGTQFAVVEGYSPVDALLEYALSDGSFEHVINGGANAIATQQAHLAMIAYLKYLDANGVSNDGKTSIYYLGVNNAEDLYPPVISTSLKDARVNGDSYSFTASASDAIDGKVELTVTANDVPVEEVDGKYTVALKKTDDMKTVIKLYAKDNANNEITLTYTLTYTEDILVSAIELPTRQTFTVGESGQLIATVIPENAVDKTLEWNSSDESVASVDNTGKITAKKSGTAVITVSSTDGSNISASCTIICKLPDSGVDTTIRVTFSLLGDEAHGENTDTHTLSGGGLDTWIEPTEVYIETGKTVGDVFRLLLTENGYTYVGLEKNYISSITTPDGEILAEFTNGTKSGWMYTVNSTHPEVGLNDYTLKNGDVIVWHYTDDYTLEEGSNDNSKNRATYADKLIDLIGTVTLDSKSAIDQARKVYDELTDAEKALVTKYTTLTAAEAAYEQLVKDNAAAAAVVEKINAIGTVTLDSESAIKAVEAAYNELTDAQKALVVNAGKLTEARTAYDKLVAEIAAVVAQINAIGEVTLDSKTAIEAAEAAYAALTEAQKEQVTNYETLTAARAAYDKLVAEFPVIPDIPVIPSPPSTPTTPSKPSTPTEPEQPVEPETPAVSFTDISGHWATDAIEYVVANGLMNGTGNGQFSPNANTTRGMIVTILARLEGVDTTTGSIWYEAGRQWAMEMGISDGTSMDGQITREQLATMLYRYAQLKGYDVSARADLGSFADADSVSDWATEAMQWAVSVGLIQGSDNQLTPNAPATRAQVATILMRFIENLAK